MDFLRTSKACIDYSSMSISFLPPQDDSPSLSSTQEFFDPDEQFMAIETTPPIPPALQRLFQKFPDIIGTIDRIGRMRVRPFSIILKPNSHPVQARAYRLPFSQVQSVKEHIKYLESLGIIRPSNSLYASPTFIVPKKDGSIRMVHDYRKLNAQTVVPSYPLPHLDDLIHRLEGRRVFTSLDFNNGYYQIPLDPATRALTAFVLAFGKWEYNFMPQGLCGPPMHFQQEMNERFAHLGFVFVFMDDILVASSSYEEHLVHLEEVFQILSDLGATLNMEKCHFLQEKVTYLGMEISQNSIRPAPRNLELLRAMKMPTTKRGIRRILGSINFFRSMIPNLSTRLHPITSKTSDSVPFSWTAADTALITSIIDELCNKAALVQPDYSQPFDVHTDASDFGVGAIVSQNGKPLYCFSRKLTGAQLRYTTTEKEALAIIWALQHLRSMLFGQRVIIHTDHSNLTFMNESQSPRIQRWKLLLDEFQPTIRYIKGEDNCVADYLSRLPDINAIDTDLRYPFSLDVIREYQLEDSQCHGILTTESTPPVPLVVKDNLLVHATSGIPFIPTALRPHCIRWMHSSLQHAGITKTVSAIRILGFWKTLYNDTISFINGCSCQKFKSSHKSYGKLQGTLPVDTPFRVVGIDFQGPFTFDPDDDGSPVQTYILTPICHASYALELIPLYASEITGEAISKAFDREWLCRYPRPEVVICDQGSQFLSHEFRELCDSYGIKLSPTTSYNPQGNSICERLHLTVNNALRATQATDLSGLPSIAWSIRSSFHRRLGCSPGELIFGCHMLDCTRSIDRAAQLHQMRSLTHQAQTTARDKENASRIDFSFQPNQLVYVKNHKPRKLAPRYSGPHRILEAFPSNNTCRVDFGSYTDVINFRRLKPCFSQEEDNVVLQ
jgi:hypothetical protein